jgi:hypothetical protein
MSDQHDTAYNRLFLWAQQFTDRNDSQPIDGEYYDLPGTVVYHTTRNKLEGGGRLEVNLVTESAHEAFSWRAEITIDELATETYQHILLQTDGSIVETYGKQVIPVDTEAAEQILATISRLDQS